MEQNIKTTLSFSEPYLKAEMIENVTNYKIDQKAVIINSGEKDIIVEGKLLSPWQSSIYNNVIISNADSS